MSQATDRPARHQTVGMIVLLYVLASAFIPVGYLTTSAYMAAAPTAYYGLRGWNESISARPEGKNAVRFSTGEVVSLSSTSGMIALGLLMLMLFLFLATAATLPVLHALRVLLRGIAPGAAMTLDDFLKIPDHPLGLHWKTALGFALLPALLAFNVWFLFWT
jgi:hypothetical protein